MCVQCMLATILTALLLTAVGVRLLCPLAGEMYTARTGLEATETLQTAPSPVLPVSIAARPSVDSADSARSVDMDSWTWRKKQC